MKLSQVTLLEAIPHPARGHDVKNVFMTSDPEIHEIYLEGGLVHIVPVRAPNGSPARKRRLVPVGSIVKHMQLLEDEPTAEPKVVEARK